LSLCVCIESYLLGFFLLLKLNPGVASLTDNIIRFVAGVALIALNIHPLGNMIPMRIRLQVFCPLRNSFQCLMALAAGFGWRSLLGSIFAVTAGTRNFECLVAIRRKRTLFLGKQAACPNQ